MIQVQDLKIHYGDFVAVDNLSFSVKPGSVFGLIGPNGAGKTTLMRTLIDPSNADTGDVVFRNGIKIRYLSQQPAYADGLTVREVLYQSDHPGLDALRAYEKVLMGEGDTDAMQAALDRVEITGGWTIEGRIQEMHSRMNLPDMERKVDRFSGGEIKRLALAQLFIEEPDLILMDEPTNHLDLDIIEWLEEYLINYKGALLMITHDRYFLERVCGTTVSYTHLTLPTTPYV